MRGLVTAGRVVRLERASLSTKANVASSALVVHRSRVDPVPRAGFRIQPAGKDIVDDLVSWGGSWRRWRCGALRGCGQVDDLPDGGAAGGRGGCGVKGGRRPSRQRSRQRPLRLEVRSPYPARRAKTAGGGAAASVVVVPVGEHLAQATSVSGSSGCPGFEGGRCNRRGGCAGYRS